jgi:MFS family permease
MFYIILSVLGFIGFLFNIPVLFQIGGWFGVYYCVFNLLGTKEKKELIIFYLIPAITGLLTLSISNMLIASIVVMAIGSISQLIKSKSGLDTKASLIQKKVSENSTELSETPYETQKRKIGEESKTKKVFKIIGIAVLTLLVVASWFFGFFEIVFYILGFYTALYFLSLLFKTTAIIDTILVIGGIILYLGFAVLGLFLLYLVLRYIFEENFFIGLLLFIFGIPLVEMLFYALIMALGAPLIYFRSLLEEKFGAKNRYF